MQVWEHREHMADHLPDLNSGILAPVADEVTIEDFTVSGALPPELSGLLIRNGPNPFDGRFAGTDMLSWWVGPAMLHGLLISEGQAHWYRNRWVRTGDWARRFSPATPSGESHDQNVNVNVLHHGGQLFALGEGGLPFIIDEELATIGPTTFDGSLSGGSGFGGMTAHPNVDPETGELRYFRADWQAPFLRYGVLDQHGRQIVDQIIDLPGPAMMHDFATTATRSIFLDLNVAYDFSMLQHGAAIPLRWHDDRVARIGIMPSGGGTLQWVEIEPCFIQHVINAYDVGTDTVILDAVRYPSFLRFDRGLGGFEPNPLGVAWRYTIRLGTGAPTAEETQLDDKAIEFPRIDDARIARQHRYVYAVEQPTDIEMRGVIKYDLTNDRTQRYAVPVGDQNAEPIFVARRPQRAGGDEDDGWLVVCVYRAATDTTDVVIIDAQDIEAAPVATVHLPRRIPAGFHGTWIPRPAAQQT